MVKPYSDDFLGSTLDPKWTIVYDTEESSVVELDGAGQLRIDVPADTPVGYARVLDEIGGPYILQEDTIASSAADNFVLTLQCNSAFTNGAAGSGEQSWGILLYNTDAEFLVFGIFKEEAGTVRARWITNVGSLNNTKNVTRGDYVPGYQIRVTRTWNSGNNSSYLFETSPDGTAWTEVGTGGPTAKTAGGLRPGIFVGNTGASAVSWTPLFGFIEEDSDPLAGPEPDGGMTSISSTSLISY